MINVRNEGGDITTDCTAIKGVMKEYYEQLYDNKFDRLDEGVFKNAKYQSPLKEK